MKNTCNTHYNKATRASFSARSASMGTVMFLLSIIALFAGCKKYTEEQKTTGLLSFTVATNDTALYASKIALSVVNSDSTFSITNQLYPLYRTEKGYSLEPIEVPAGNYTILSAIVYNHENLMLMLSPKAGSIATLQAHYQLPSNLAVHSTKTTTIELEAYTPKSLSLTPKDFGYNCFGQGNTKPTDYYFKDEICVQIGVDGQYNPNGTIQFKVLADDSIVLYGKCSQNYSSFSIPSGATNYTVMSTTSEETEVQTFSANELEMFSCSNESGAFINLMEFDYSQYLKDSDNIDIYFILQTYLDPFYQNGQGLGKGSLGNGQPYYSANSDANPHYELSIIDNNGTMFATDNSTYINDSTMQGKVVIGEKNYQQLIESMKYKIWKVNKDSLRFYYEKCIALEPEEVKSDTFKQIRKKLYAIKDMGNGRHKAIQVNWWYNENPDYTKPPQFGETMTWMQKMHVWQTDFFEPPTLFAP